MKLNDLSSYFELYRTLEESGKDMVLNDDLLHKEKEFVKKEITVSGVVNEIDVEKNEIIVTYRDDSETLKRLISAHFFVFASNHNIGGIVKQFNVEKNDLVSLTGTIVSLHRQSALRMNLISLSVTQKNYGLTKRPDRRGCFIATAVYESDDTEEVKRFYEFRDKVLAKSIGGRLFIRFYYLVSPRLAKVIEHKPVLKSFIRKNILDKMIARFEGS